MTRFDHLELDETSSRQENLGSLPANSTGTPVRNAEFYLKEAEEAYRLGNYEMALRFFSKALEDDHTCFPGWFGQVRMLLELREYKEAGIWSDRALELFPEHPDLLAAKAVALIRTGLFDNALALSDNALSHKGASPYCWLARAEILLAMKAKTAEFCIAKVLNTADSPTVKAQMGFELSRVLRMYGRLSQALTYASAAAQAMPGDAAVWLELGRCQRLLGMNEAGTSFQQALTLNPNLDQAHDELHRFQHRGIRGRIHMVLRRLFRR